MITPIILFLKKKNDIINYIYIKKIKWQQQYLIYYLKITLNNYKTHLKNKNI